LFGLTVMTYVLKHLGFLADRPLIWPRLHSVCDAGACVVGYEWILRVGRTKPSKDPHTRFGEILLCVAQGLAIFYGLMGITFPALRGEVSDPGWNPAVFSRPAFYLFSIPFHLSLALAGVRVVQLLRTELEHAEKVRLIAFALATPFFVSLLVVPGSWGPFITV